jgi:plastocyanin
MRNIFLILFFLCAGTSFSQTTHDVTVTNFSFSPQTLTINTGDAVRWTNVLGNHNVVADDNSFTSGPLAPAPWEYTHTFSAVGNNPYYCELHGGPGGSGMS